MFGRGLNILSDMCRSHAIELTIDKELDAIEQVSLICEALTKNLRSIQE
jgi:hypothetical protein